MAIIPNRIDKYKNSTILYNKYNIIEATIRTKTVETGFALLLPIMGLKECVNKWS